MAKKLNRQMLEEMVLQTINESSDVNEILGAIKSFIRPSTPTTTPFTGKGVKPSYLRSGESQAEQALKAIQSAKLSQDIKDYLIDLITPSLVGDVTAKQDTKTGQDSEEVPTALMPTAKLTPSAQERARLRTLGNDETTAKMSSVSYPKGAAPQPVRKIAEGLNLETLVAEVLAEMSKKKPTKETKKPVKK